MRVSLQPLTEGIYIVVWRAVAPFLERQGWEVVINKMINAFGAPIKPADAKVIIDYLAENYGSAADNARRRTIALVLDRGAWPVVLLSGEPDIGKSPMVTPKPSVAFSRSSTFRTTRLGATEGAGKANEQPAIYVHDRITFSYAHASRTKTAVAAAEPLT
jgi:hypothetical protein